MTDVRIRKSERNVYTVAWVLVAALYVLNLSRMRMQGGRPMIDCGLLLNSVLTLFPFFLLFFANNMLMRRYLLRNRVGRYFVLAACLLLVFFAYEYFAFHAHLGADMPRRRDMGPPPDERMMKPLLPMPLLLDFAYGIVVVGCNLAVGLMFQRFDDQILRERFMKDSAEHQLAYLKDQINPHFYMNMLNNIHGMIEIDSDKAQTMVLDMSHLMRYMLYESSLPWIPLADEVEFLNNYMRLMRIRYPENRVSVSCRFPSKSEMRGNRIPPILFLMFVENAFKHGVSYQDPSFVAVEISIGADTVEFTCVNSNHSDKNRMSRRSQDDKKEDSGGIPTDSGIGLANIRKRLEIIYGRSATLKIEDTISTYTVNLIIPKHNA